METSMAERLEPWTIVGVVLYLNAAEDVLQCRIYCSASGWPVEIVFAEVDRIVKLGADVFMEVVIRRQVKSTQGLLLAEHVVNRKTSRVAGEIINEERGISAEEFELLVVVLGHDSYRGN